MGLDIKLEGQEVVKSVCDLFSPVTELAGALGDKVRIYRELAVLRTLNRAKEIAKEEGLILEAPSLKFLVPYLESVSVEDEDNSVLQEMWANLLVSSSSGFESEYNFFIRVLGEISSKEASAFSYIVSSHEHKNYSGFYFLEEVNTDWSDSFVYIKIRSLLSEYKNVADIEFNDFEEKFRKEYQSPGSYIYFFDVASGEKDMYPLDSIHTSGRSDFDDLWDDKTFSILTTLGLLGKFESPEYWFGAICL